MMAKTNVRFPKAPMVLAIMLISILRVGQDLASLKTRSCCIRSDRRGGWDHILMGMLMLTRKQMLIGGMECWWGRDVDKMGCSLGWERNWEGDDIGDGNGTTSVMLIMKIGGGYCGDCWWSVVHVDWQVFFCFVFDDMSVKAIKAGGMEKEWKVKN